MANSWSNTFQSSITLPTGATTGARIVLDGANDVILIYNSANQLVDTIGGPDGAITIGPANGAQVVLQQHNGLGTIFFPTGDSGENTAAQINSGVANQNLPTEFMAITMTGPSVDTFSDKIRFQLNSQAEDGSSNANFELVTDHSNNTTTGIMVGDQNQVSIQNALLVQGNAQFNGWINANNYVHGANEIVGTVNVPGQVGGGTTSIVVTGFNLTNGPNGSGFGCLVTADTSVPGTDLMYVSYTAATATQVTLHMNRTSNTTTLVTYMVRGL